MRCDVAQQHADRHERRPLAVHEALEVRPEAMETVRLLVDVLQALRELDRRVANQRDRNGEEGREEEASAWTAPSAVRRGRRRRRRRPARTGPSPELFCVRSTRRPRRGPTQRPSGGASSRPGPAASRPSTRGACLSVCAWANGRGALELLANALTRRCPPVPRPPLSPGRGRRRSRVSPHRLRRR